MKNTDKTSSTEILS